MSVRLIGRKQKNQFLRNYSSLLRNSAFMRMNKKYIITMNYLMLFMELLIRQAISKLNAIVTITITNLCKQTAMNDESSLMTTLVNKTFVIINLMRMIGVN